jgi:uncharacterized iron-regulated protein
MVRISMIVALALCCGCAVRGPAQQGAALPEPRSVLLFAGETGEAIPWEELVAAASGADAVIIGENHGHPLGLAVAAALFDDVVARGRTAALSMEFFARDDQSRIDDYLTDLIDEATFKRRTGRVESNYPPGHRQMVEAAKAAGLPVYAANAPRSTVRIVNRGGFERLDELTAEQQRLFRVPDYEFEGRYRDDFMDVMAAIFGEAHGVDGSDPGVQERMIEGMFRSQSLWDWTMADTIARAMEAGHRPVVHVVGRFHSDFGGGLVQALESLDAGANILTISMAPAWSEGLAEDDAGRADVIVYVGPE